MGARLQPEPNEPGAAAQPWRLVLPLAAAIFLGLGFLAFVSVFARALAVVLVAITIATLLLRRMRRTLAVVLVYVAVIGVLALIGLLLAPRLMSEMQQLSDQGPKLIEDVRRRLAAMLSLPAGEAGRLLARAVQKWSDRLMEMPLAVGWYR